MDASSFKVSMQFNNLLNRDHNPNPKLNVDELSTIDRLVSSYVKWSDLEESILELVGLK